jgi:hypothetical protein
MKRTSVNQILDILDVVSRYAEHLLAIGDGRQDIMRLLLTLTRSVKLLGEPRNVLLHGLVMAMALLGSSQASCPGRAECLAQRRSQPGHANLAWGGEITASSNGEPGEGGGLRIVKESCEHSTSTSGMEAGVTIVATYV